MQSDDNATHLTMSYSLGKYIVGVAASALLGGMTAAHGSDAYVDGEVLIQYRSSLTGVVQDTLPPGYHMQVVSPGVASVVVDKNRPLADAIDELRSHPAITHVQPNYIKRIQQFPDNARFDIQWGLDNQGQLIPDGNTQFVRGVADADIDAPEAWDVTTGDRNIVIAVIDTGVDLQHPDLSSNLWQSSGEAPNGIDDDGNGYVDDFYGWDFAQDDNFPDDGNGHGTYMASAIGARGHGAIQVAGLNWQVSLMVLRAFDSQGASKTSTIVEAIRYAVDNGAQVINASYGAMGGASQGALSFDQMEYDAYDYARQNGVLVVAAACNQGNDNDQSNSCVPASYDLDNIIAVAATDQSDRLADFSNYGSNSVDLAAPGVNIAASLWKNYEVGTVTIIDGTSIASAFVSGAAGLVLARARDLDKTISVGSLRDLILDNVDDLPNELGGRIATAGRLNVAKAVAAVDSIQSTQQNNNSGSGSTGAKKQPGTSNGGMWSLPGLVVLTMFMLFRRGGFVKPDQPS